MSIGTHFVDMARYSAWANRRLFEAAAALGDDERKRDIGLFFGSLHATLNHLLVTDRIWMWRITGEDPEPGPLDRQLHAGFAPLVEARLSEDARLLRIVGGFGDDAFGEDVRYANMAGQRFAQPLAAILAHLFNHQAHHRGQAHAALSILTGAEPPSLDMILYHRGFEAPSENALRAAVQ